MSNKDLTETLLQLADRSGYGIFQIRNGRFIYVSPSFSRIFGYSERELLEVNFESLIHPLWKEVVINEIQKSNSKSCTFKALRKDGEEIFINVISRKSGSSGSYTITGYVNELIYGPGFTKKETEAIMNIFLNSIGDFVFLMNEKGRVIFANNPFGIGKLKTQMFVGKKPDEILPEKFSKRFYESLKENKNGRISEYEVELEIDDEIRHFHVKQSPIILNKRYRGVVLVVRDITEIRRAYKKLKQSESRYRALFENVPVGLYTTTPEGDIVNFNPQSSLILGYSKEELKGKKALDFYVNKGERNEWLKELFKKGSVEREFRMKRKDGKIIWLKDTSRLRKDEEGKIYIEGSLQDITELKNLEASLRENLRKMEKLFDSTVMALSSAVEVRDLYTAGHQKRVTQLAIEIAKEMGLVDRIKALKIAGLLHDIGKIAIPSDILTKPTRLTEVEYMLVKHHPVTGYQILKKIEFPWPVATIVLQHHERLDGSGYPEGLKDGDILIEARIIAVADVVEAISSHRPYRPALGTSVALDEIKKHRGTLYDKDVVDACIEVFKKGFKFPVP